MTTAQITAVIASALEGDGGSLPRISGIGRVHQYVRFFRDRAAFEEHHSTGGTINSATITLDALRPAELRDVRRGGSLALVYERQFSITIMRGQYDAEASQHILADLVVDVIEALDSEEARTALSAAGFEYGSPSAETIGLATYGTPPFITVNQAVVTLTLREVLS